MIQEKAAFHKNHLSFVAANQGQPCFIPIIDKLLTILHVWSEANRVNNKTIPIKTAIGDESKVPLDNAYPKIRNSDYVTGFLSRLRRTAQSTIL